jgi:hypothetical protein
MASTATLTVPPDLIFAHPDTEIAMQSNVKVQETSKVHLGGMSPSVKVAKPPKERPHLGGMSPSVKTAKPPKERPHLGGMSPSVKKAEPRNVRGAPR